ncbi:MAG TPA: ATP-binding protein [Actinomycetota bacterium]|nr:ATP-binding protein [Actinomycetota bacterium]
MGDRERANILLVDDRPENLVALQAALEPLDQNLISAGSGEEALRLLLKQEFAVILLDVQMPGMDGFQTAAQIKQREKTRDIPIIFLTAISREPHHALRGYSTGAVDYIAKPYDPWVLRAKVAVFIDLHHKNELLKLQKELLAQRLEERVRAEEALAEKAAELERSNADLQHFAYVASHDLQEPLRVIDGYVELLKTNVDGSDPAEALDMIERITRSTARMDALIRGLLAYARVGSKTDGFKPIDLNAVVDEALQNLEVAIAENDVAIDRRGLPQIEGDPQQLVQLFQNLIGNAIKFRGQDRPQVTISGQRDGSNTVVTVTDNGIGIDDSHLDRIFTIFERLHSADRYPGSGIGLSLCKKIVERHGGRIWAESTLGAGTSIHFTLPVSS